MQPELNHGLPLRTLIQLYIFFLFFFCKYIFRRKGLDCPRDARRLDIPFTWVLADRVPLWPCNAISYTAQVCFAICSRGSPFPSSPVPFSSCLSNWDASLTYSAYCHCGGRISTAFLAKQSIQSEPFLLWLHAVSSVHHRSVAGLNVLCLTANPELHWKTAVNYVAMCECSGVFFKKWMLQCARCWHGACLEYSPSHLSSTLCPCIFFFTSITGHQSQV